MKKRTRILSLLLAALLLAGAVSCSSGGNGKTDDLAASPDPAADAPAGNSPANIASERRNAANILDVLLSAFMFSLL